MRILSFLAISFIFISLCSYSPYNIEKYYIDGKEKKTIGELEFVKFKNGWVQINYTNQDEKGTYIYFMIDKEDLVKLDLPPE